MCSEVQKSHHTKDDERSVTVPLQKTDVVTFPGACGGVLHLEEDIADLDKIQRRARKTSSDTADGMTDYMKRD